MGNIFGVVILYYPAEDYIQNLRSYLHAVQQLIVIDNSEDKIPFPEELVHHPRILIIQDGVNKGVAQQLNIAASVAYTQKADWLLTMDQDSFFEKAHIEQYINCFQNFKGKENVAMFGVNYEEKKEVPSCESTDAELLITSGSIVNLPLLKQLGGFDEKLFIDEVDTEYCIRARQAHYRIVRFMNICLEHQLGSPSHQRSFRTLKKSHRSLHNPLRLYYMVRNHLYVKKKYAGQYRRLFQQRRKALLNSIKNNLLYGKQPLRTLKYLYLARKDYKKQKMGKIFASS